MQITRIGDFEVHRVTEYEGPFFPPADFFPDFDPEVVRANPDLMGPRLIDPATGRLVFSFHSFVIKTGHHTILVDSCLGNDKERPTRPQFHRLRSNYLADLKQAGVEPEAIDYVMCTHLHWDHVGWNTRLDNGRWVPTFPNARYVMARREYDHWENLHKDGEDTPHRRAFEDSVLPVVRTGQSQLVDDDFALEDGLWFEPAPGHTPGNVVIHARSGADRALFLGDVLHHPLQCLRPEWSTIACTDRELSRKTRTRLIEEHAERDTRLLPAHFPTPTVGHIRRHNSTYRYDFEA
ncbi:MAG TPA: MBL fold metallo-hydrolase [Stellaceae bacterium]|jgi:glyoxylase-like metal-dependent hydrolase (beta-lactamase superfamily II)|nr:MBL fold metallo-hydrolase [Stellaceae bacterium]